jgi:uncharacterized membrane protein YbhN (UPF0104 family)
VSSVPHAGAHSLPESFSPRALARRALPILIALTALVLVALLAPGLGSVREHLAGASPGWLALGVVLELASCISYVAMFRPVFCRTMHWRVLWATFHAVGPAPPLMILLMGYLIGQLGGLLPLPGGVGGIDGGLIGTLVVYGAPAAATVAAVLAYRLILFWTPLLAGTPAFIALWRHLPSADRPGVEARPA